MGHHEKQTIKTLPRNVFRRTPGNNHPHEHEYQNDIYVRQLLDAPLQTDVDTQRDYCHHQGNSAKGESERLFHAEKRTKLFGDQRCGQTDACCCRAQKANHEQNINDSARYFPGAATQNRSTRRRKVQ